MERNKQILGNGTEVILCQMYTRKRDDIADHIHSNPEENKYVCANCKAVRSTMDEAILHFEERHPKMGVLTCNQCNNEFRSNVTFRDHLKDCNTSENDSFIIECKYCDLKFKNPKNLRFHARTSHSNRKQLKQLLKPKRERQVDQKYSMKCNECDYITFNNAKNLERHVKKIHLKQRDFMCNDCFALFTELKSLQNHNKANQPNPAIPGDVAQCSKYFKILSNPMDQIKRDEERGEFGCWLCEFKSAAHESTVKHVREKHTLRLTYTCSKCSNFAGVKCKVLEHWKVCSANLN
jgi:hypothetical protein